MGAHRFHIKAVYCCGMTSGSRPATPPNSGRRGGVAQSGLDCFRVGRLRRLRLPCRPLPCRPLGAHAPTPTPSHPVNFYPDTGARASRYVAVTGKSSCGRQESSFRHDALRVAAHSVS